MGGKLQHHHPIADQASGTARAAGSQPGEVGLWVGGGGIAGLPSGYVVSQYMPGGFVVAEPGMGRAVNR
jgi:hypothetical protein